VQLQIGRQQVGQNVGLLNQPLLFPVAGAVDVGPFLGRW